MGHNQHDPHLRPLRTRHLAGGLTPCGRWEQTAFWARCGLMGSSLRSPLKEHQRGTVPRWVRQLPVPVLSRRYRGDGQSLQPQGQGREAIDPAAGELRYLPPYSPDLNPIELAFRSSKSCSRRRPNGPSTNSGNSAAVLDQFTRSVPKLFPALRLPTHLK